MLREDLEKAKSGVLAAHELLQEFVGEFELPDPKSGEVEQVREFILHFAEERR